MMKMQLIYAINFDSVASAKRVRTWTRSTLWPAHTCDRAYTWCIYAVFVSLSHQYAAEVKAGCNDPAMTGQLAVAYLLVWMVTH